jgi:phosphoglycolate phosphatase
MMPRSELFSGAKETIIDLAKKYNLIIISSSLTNSIIQVLKNNGIEHMFTEVLGNDVDTSKANKMKMVFDKYKVTNNDVLFITDTIGDIREAKYVNIPTFAVTWGFHDRVKLEKESPLKIIDSFQELSTEIDKYFL